MTTRQRRFIAEYLASGNGTQAAIRAGYSKHTAKEIASQNLTKPEIAAAIAEKHAEQVKRLEITAADIARVAWEIATDTTRPTAARVSALALLARRHPEYSEKHEWVDPEEVRRLAEQFGLNPERVLAEAESILRGR